MNAEHQNFDSGTSECTALVLTFFRALDQRDHATVSMLLAPQGIWHRQGKKLVGPQAVRDALDARDPDRHTAHVVTNLVVAEVTPDTATARFYLIAYEYRDGVASSDSVPRLVAIRDCVDHLVRIEGRWLIANKTSRRQLPPEPRPID